MFASRPSWPTLRDSPTRSNGRGFRHTQGHHYRRRSAEQRDEIATLQMIELHSVPAGQGRMQDIELARSSQRGIHACSRSDVDCANARTAGYEGSSRTGPRDRIS